MADVCCPKCWTWQELGKRTTCKACGTALILADGRTVAQAAASPGVAAPGMVPAYAGGTPAFPMGQSRPTGIDWVFIARLITLGYGALIFVGLVILSIAVPHISVPVTDPNTGVTTNETLNLGPVFAIVAVIVGGTFLLLAWLTRFFIARIIFLIFDGLAVLSALAHFGAGQTVSVISGLDLVVDLVYGAVLLMSIMSPRREYR
jgi:hypothetical protein